VNYLNINIKVVSNNIFVLFLSLTLKLKKIYSIGFLGFRHKNKKILDVFNLLLNNCLTYLLVKQFFIQELKLDGVSFSKIKLIKKVWFLLVIKQCKFLLKYNHNGCRLKKKKRTKIGYKIKRNNKLILRI
jgi:hypothetical protein